MAQRDASPCALNLVCPICVKSRKLDADTFVANARLAGAATMWEWLGDEPGTVFSY